MKDNWIPVSERLPDLDKKMTWWNDETDSREEFGEKCFSEVLAYNETIGYFKAKYEVRYGKPYWSEVSSNSIRGNVTPTHWMRFPEPPC